MIIYFLRHLKTLGNYERRYIGRTDEDLFDTQNQTLSCNLPKQPDKIFVSPMKRCLQTKDLAYAEKSFVIHENLRETDFGDFENKTYEDLKDNIHYRNFIDGTEDAINGESREHFKTRCISAFKEIVDNCEPQDTAVIICHGGTIMSILEKFDIDKKDFYSYQIKNGEFLKCIWDGKNLRIEEENS